MSNIDEVERQEISLLLAKLVHEHADLDQQVALLTVSASTDQLFISRMKKRKLLLKDMIVKLKSEVMPDLPA